MSDNKVDSMKHFEARTSYMSSSNTLHPSFSRNHVGLEVITTSDDYGSEGMFEPSIKGEISSLGLLDALKSYIGGRKNCTGIPMPISILYEEEIRVHLQRRDLNRDFIQTRL
ncbi:unnamed protein product [Vicia faba]|uniref:Uncharacterized protein n=1 Tax=Vicia faba TaxID=3906 RepID=A0AAV1BB39_VICFA|nr:unnamed protein product [Vicia faba]